MSSQIQGNEYKNAEAIFGEIRELIGLGMEALQKAAEKICLLVDLYPGQLEMLCAREGLALTMCRRLEKVGRRLLAPELLTKSGRGWRALEQMPYEVQTRHLRAPVEVVTLPNDVLLVAVENLCGDQAKQVFDVTRGVVRDRAAQRAWLAANERSHTPPRDNRSARYRVTGKTAVFAEGGEFTRAELLSILQQMKD